MAFVESHKKNGSSSVDLVEHQQRLKEFWTWHIYQSNALWTISGGKSQKEAKVKSILEQVLCFKLACLSKYSLQHCIYCLLANGTSHYNSRGALSSLLGLATSRATWYKYLYHQ